MGWPAFYGYQGYQGYKGYEGYVEEQMPPEAPPLFGLHPNAEIGYLTNTAIATFKVC